MMAGRKTQYKKVKWIPRWVKFILVGFLFMAIFRNYIANDLPLYSNIDGKHYFPVLAKDMQYLGLGHSFGTYLFDLKNKTNSYNIATPIPYHANTIDRNNIHYISPFSIQNVSSYGYRHHLGTDQLGRDVLARIIHGSYTALRVALFSSLIALILGLFFGLLAGYYQDDKWRMNRWSLALWILGGLLAWYLSFYIYSYELLHGNWIIWSQRIGLMLILFFIVYQIDLRIVQKWNITKHSIPLDLFIMRFIESYKSIPLLLLIFTVLAMIEKASLSHVIWMIGLTRWPTIARYIRAEVLHIRRQAYISAAVAAGLPDRNIIWNHTLPHAISPIIVTIAFSMSSAILLESTLSFLGIGIPSETISWGAIIQSARNVTDAWWVAVFPGLAIFLLVLVFNKIAERINTRE